MQRLIPSLVFINPWVQQQTLVPAILLWPGPDIRLGYLWGQNLKKWKLLLLKCRFPGRVFRHMKSSVACKKSDGKMGNCSQLFWNVLLFLHLKNPRKIPPEYSCDICGKPTAVMSHGARRKTCSDACYAALLHRNAQNRPWCAPGQFSFGKRKWKHITTFLKFPLPLLPMK